MLSVFLNIHYFESFLVFFQLFLMAFAKFFASLLGTPSKGTHSWLYYCSITSLSSIYSPAHVSRQNIYLKFLIFYSVMIRKDKSKRKKLRTDVSGKIIKKY